MCHRSNHVPANVDVLWNLKYVLREMTLLTKDAELIQLDSCFAHSGHSVQSVLSVLLLPCLRLSPISLLLVVAQLSVLDHMCIVFGFMINTNWLHVFLVESGNVACPSLGIQGHGSATGVFLYQYSFMRTRLPNDAANGPSLWHCYIRRAINTVDHVMTVTILNHYLRAKRPGEEIHFAAI